MKKNKVIIAVLMISIIMTCASAFAGEDAYQLPMYRDTITLNKDSDGDVTDLVITAAYFGLYTNGDSLDEDNKLFFSTFIFYDLLIIPYYYHPILHVHACQGENKSILRLKLLDNKLNSTYVYPKKFIMDPNEFGYFPQIDDKERCFSLYSFDFDLSKYKGSYFDMAYEYAENNEYKAYEIKYIAKDLYGKSIGPGEKYIMAKWNRINVPECPDCLPYGFMYKDGRNLISPYWYSETIKRICDYEKKKNQK